MIADVVVAGLASWRLALIMVQEDGPLDLAQRWRDLWRVDAPGPKRGFAKLFGCVWCLSVWLAMIFWLVLQAWSPPAEIFAAAGVALLAHLATDRQDG